MPHSDLMGENVGEREILKLQIEFRWHHVTGRIHLSVCVTQAVLEDSQTTKIHNRMFSRPTNPSPCPTSDPSHVSGLG